MGLHLIYYVPLATKMVVTCRLAREVDDAYEQSTLAACSVFELEMLASVLVLAC